MVVMMVEKNKSKNRRAVVDADSYEITKSTDGAKPERSSSEGRFEEPTS
jgi:hypothetical protein